jgi:hypothetical protein
MSARKSTSVRRCVLGKTRQVKAGTAAVQQGVQRQQHQPALGLIACHDTADPLVYATCVGDCVCSPPRDQSPQHAGHTLTPDPK